jgi:hypothetical protein
MVISTINNWCSSGDHLCLRHQRPESHAQTHHFGGKVKVADFHDIRFRQEPPL